MDKEDVKRQYHTVRDAKLALDAMLGAAPPEVVQEFRNAYARDTGALYAVTTHGVPASARMWTAKSRRPTRASRSVARYQAAVTAAHVAMINKGWVE